jgi:hypothetical protein
MITSDAVPTRRGWLRVSVLAVACVSALAACSSATGHSSASTTAPKPPVTSTGGSPAQAASLIEGTWQTGSVSVDQMVSVLRDAGLQKWVQPFRARAGVGQTNVFWLTVADGLWHEEYSKDGGGFSDFDDATYQVQGNMVVLSRGARQLLLVGARQHADAGLRARQHGGQRAVLRHPRRGRATGVLHRCAVSPARLTPQAESTGPGYQRTTGCSVDALSSPRSGYSG